MIRLFSLFVITWASVVLNVAACASTSPTATSAPSVEVTKPAAEPQPIQIMDPGNVQATLDPKTLKVTYAKNGDPKKVVDQLVKAWAEAVNNLQRCQAELNKK